MKEWFVVLAVAQFALLPVAMMIPSFLLARDERREKKAEARRSSIILLGGAK
jgi:hypothetical protein